MSFPPQGNKADVSAIATAAALATVDANVDTLIARLTAARAGYMDALNRGRPDMIFPSRGGSAIVVLPAVAADLDFPNVIVEGLPSGITIARVDYALVIGGLLDTSSSENQIDQAAKTIRIKKSTGAWATPADQIVAYTFQNTGLQCGADAYRGGLVLFGGVDIKSIADGNATYNFRSEETNNSEGVTVTGASLECLDVFSVMRFWFN